MQISGVSLTLTWPCRLCLLRVLCLMTLLQAFPFPSTLGEVTLHPLSLACVFVYSSHGKCVFPPVLWSFPSTAAFTSFLTPGCWARTSTPTLFGLPGLFIYSSGKESPPPFSAQGAPPFSQHVFCLLVSFSFLPGWRSVCPGGYAVLAQGCLWEYCVLLSLPCLHLPMLSGARRLEARRPSLFLLLT
jgi:hypothetical protein